MPARFKGGGGGGGPSGPAGFSDDFTVGVTIADSSTVPTDAMSLAFQFDEAANVAPDDAISLAFQLDDPGNATPTDDATYALSLLQADTSTVPTDDATYAAALLQADTNADLTETVGLAVAGAGISDSSASPTDSKSFTMLVWLSGSAGTGSTNPANANGQNNATVATLQTASLGTNPITLISTLGASLPSVTVTQVIYRGWFKSVNQVTTSTGSVIMHSSSALFSDVTMFSNSATSSTVDHLAGTFTFDLIAAGINTLAKLQSCQVYHRVNDLVAGVTPHVLTVDAGCLEVTGAFS